MSLALILLGTALVAVALFNRVPRLRAPAPSAGARPTPTLRLHTAPARLTEAGRALVTTVGGSALIIAFFLALSGL